MTEYIINSKIEGKSQSTIALYERWFRQYLARGCDFTATNIRAYLLAEQERGLAPATIHNEHRCLKAFSNWMVGEKYLLVSPMANIKPPRLPEVLIVPFADHEIAAFLAQCQSNGFIDVRNKAMLLIFLDSGLRRFELAAVQVPNIDVSTGNIKVMGKGRRERVVKVGKTALKALWRYLLMRKDIDCPELWLTEEKRPLTPDGFKTVFRRLAYYADITRPHRGPHTFRHTFATRALRNGADPYWVQLLMGHSTPTMTRRYTKTISPDMALEAHKQFSPVDRMKL